MIDLIACLVLTVLTSAAVALHGGNWFSKGYIMVGHLLAVCAAMFLMGGGLISFAGALIICLYFWFVFRNTPVVQAEQDAMQWPTDTYLSRVLYINVGTCAFASAACVGGFFYIGSWAQGLIALPLVVVSAVPFFAIKHWLNFKTSFGVKMGKRLDKILKKRWAESNGKPVNADKILTLRNCIEIVAGLLPCGVGVATMAYTVVEVLSHVAS